RVERANHLRNLWWRSRRPWLEVPFSLRGDIEPIVGHPCRSAEDLKIWERLWLSVRQGDQITYWHVDRCKSAARLKADALRPGPGFVRLDRCHFELWRRRRRLRGDP